MKFSEDSLCLGAIEQQENTMWNLVISTEKVENKF